MEANQPEEPKTTSTAVPLAGVGAITDQVSTDAARNVRSSSKPDPGPPPAASGRGEVPARFSKMPADLFMHGDDGKPILKRGKPVYKNLRGGRPRKPRPGEKLLDGSTFKGGDHTSKPNTKKPSGEGQASGTSGSSGTGRLVDPTRPVTDAASASAPAGPDPTTVELGPEAGQVIAEAALNSAEAVVGEPPTPAERSSITKSASAVASGWRLHPLIAVLLFTAAYVGRVLMVRWSKARESKPDAHTDSGPDGVRKNDAGKTTFGYGE